MVAVIFHILQARYSLVAGAVLRRLAAFILIFLTPIVFGETGLRAPRSAAHSQASTEASQRARDLGEDLVEIVWDLNDDHNIFGPKKDQIKDIELIRTNQNWLVLSKETLESLRAQGAISQARDHSIEALKELIANSVLKRRPGVPLRLRLYVDAHGFKCQDSIGGGVCADTACKEIPYDALLNDLIGKEGVIPVGDSVRLDIFVTSCFSRRAAYAFYKHFNGTEPDSLSDTRTPKSIQKINVFTASKGSKETFHSHFWDTLELVSRLERLRESPLRPEEFNDAMVAFGRIKKPPPHLKESDEWPLFVNKYSTYLPNSESSEGRPRIEPFLRLAELGMAKLDERISFCNLAERVGTFLSEPGWNISSIGDDQNRLRDSPNLIADRLAEAFVENPKALDFSHCLSDLRWQPFHLALLKKIGRGSKNRAVLLTAMSDSSNFYRSSYGTITEQFLVDALRSPDRSEREKALIVVRRVVPETTQPQVNEAVSSIAHDSDPQLRRLALYFLISREVITVDDAFERLKEERESLVRHNILLGLIEIASDPTSLNEARTRLIVAGLAEPSEIIQDEVLRKFTLSSNVQEWEAFATALESRLSDFDDSDWLTTQSQLKKYETAADLPDGRKSFWRIYNFVSELAFQRKGRLDRTRSSSVGLRKEMDGYLRRERKQTGKEGVP